MRLRRVCDAWVAVEQENQGRSSQRTSRLLLGEHSAQE
jgi:hypothetical protein